MFKPDYSPYLAHFTKDGKQGHEADNSASPYQNMSARERLISILRTKKIKASSMPWTGAKAVCFTECPWTSLLGHTEQYSSYGIGFNKRAVYVKHGGPVYYIRPDHFERQKKSGFDKHLYPFLTPFVPTYSPKKFKEQFDGSVDYTHEREWRVPHDFPFEYKDIEFVILSDYKDMASFPQDLKDSIGREKFILMENYKLIEKLWPVHKF